MLPRRGVPSATASPFTFLSPAELGSSSSREPDIVKMDPSSVVVFTTYP
jgi:hypothetical protein